MKGELRASGGVSECQSQRYTQKLTFQPRNLILPMLACAVVVLFLGIFCINFDPYISVEAPRLASRLNAHKSSLSLSLSNGIVTRVCITQQYFCNMI